MFVIDKAGKVIFKGSDGVEMTEAIEKALKAPCQPPLHGWINLTIWT